MPERSQITIMDALCDPALFAPCFTPPDSWRAWVTFILALFGLPMDEAQLALYRTHTGRQTAPTTPGREAWMVVGRRGGKSRIAALIAVYLACFRDYRAILAPGERAEILVLAADMDQAGVIFGFARGLIEEVPMLAELLEREPASQTIHLRNRVTIKVKASNFRRVRGYTLVAAILDEIAFWPTGDESANPDTEIVKALKPAMLTVPTALLLGLSSPYACKGALWNAFKKHYGVEDSRVLVWKADTLSMHPTVDRTEIDEAYRDDPVAAAAEYGAEFRRDIEDFVPREIVEALVVAGRASLPPVAGVRYAAFTDPSGGSQDSMTLAIAHQERGRAVLDVVRERRAPFSPEDVVREFAGILKEYGCARVMGDNYAKEWPVERFRVHGIAYEPADLTKSDYYAALLPLLMSQQAELLDDKVLVNQLCTLERRTSWAGRDSISHPPGGRDDVANAAAGALVLVAGRHRKMFEEWKDVRLPAEPKDLDDLLPRSWSCPRCGSTYLVGPDVQTPRCARCNPGWTREQILYGGEALGLWT